MKPLLLLLQSSIGKKFIMGVTGAALVLFVIGHLVGNLQVFLPKEAINAYAGIGAHAVSYMAHDQFELAAASPESRAARDSGLAAASSNWSCAM